MLSYNQLLKLNDAANAFNQKSEKMINLEESSFRPEEMSGITEPTQFNNLKENLSSNINGSSRITDLHQQSLELKERVSEFLTKPPAENIPSINIVKNEIFKSYNFENNFKVN